jgi:tight adherence protein B
MLTFGLILGVLAFGGLAFAFAGGDERTQKRMTAIARPQGGRGALKGTSDGTSQKRKNVAVLLKDLEKNQAATRKKERPTMRRRLEQAGYPDASPRSFWIICAITGGVAAAACLLTGQSLLVMAMAVFGVGLGLPRWVLGFLTNRRRKKFTAEFASAIDVIVRSVRSGLPTNEALRIVAKESPDPVGSEFRRLVEGMKVGVTLDQGVKKMFESMPTAEVGFFGIVMTIQAKSGGNLSEALGNLAAVLRDRKRLEGKIKAMSSEAKASAGIIGSLPPVVMGLVWFTTPAYIDLLFTEKMGNLMLAGCAVWMSIGIAVMKKMINFKT